MNENCDLLEKIILGEVDGKNKAIHAYDGISWKIRAGFMTFVFGGWGIVLKGIFENAEKTYGPDKALLWGLFVFSCGFAIGAWQIDRTYVRRKFRVIHALNRLMDAVGSYRDGTGDFPSDLLKVAGDKMGAPYDDKSYREAARVELSVYLLPVVILAVVLALAV